MSHDELLSLLLSFDLLPQTLLLLFLLLPLLVGDAGHDALICLCFLLAFLLVALDLLEVALLVRLVPLLQDRVLQPLLEHLVRRLLLCLLLQSLELLSLILLILLPLLFELLLLDPLHHPRLLLLPAHLLGRLRLSDLLQNVSLLLADQLLLKLSLMLLPPHPLLVRDGCGTAIADLRTLLNLRAVI